MTLSHNLVTRLLEKEKAKISFMWPWNLHYGVLPLLRLHMTWQIQKALHKYRFHEKLASYPLTLQTILEFSCYLYRLSRIFHRVSRDFLHCLGRSDFLNLLPLYGDAFVSSVLQTMMESIGNLQESKRIPQYLKQRAEFYHAARVKELHATLIKQSFVHNNRDTRNKIDNCLATIFDKLLANSHTMEQYQKFFGEIAPNPAVLEMLQTISQIATNVGTSKTYDVFLQFCRKFIVHSYFNDVVKIAGQLTSYQDPELFQQTFAWATASALPAEIIQNFFWHGGRLLATTSEDPKFPITCFRKFLKYAKSKEMPLLKMQRQEAEFYLQKAAEFFLEDRN
jgi:hypothetical protein